MWDSLYIRIYSCLSCIFFIYDAKDKALIVIPAYDGEKTRPCVLSAISPLLKDSMYGVLVVTDGSKNDAGSVSKNWVLKPMIYLGGWAKQML